MTRNSGTLISAPRGRLKDVSAHLSEENQTCAGGKIPSTDPRGCYVRIGSKELPALAPGAMAYMMATQQVSERRGKRWHPHVMFFVSGDAVKGWGANLAGSPVIAAKDPEQWVTTFIVLVGTWSDGKAAPSVLLRTSELGRVHTIKTISQ
jgi:hypothetical protein